MKLRRWIAIATALMLLAGMVPTAALAATASTEDWCNASLDGEHTWGNWSIRREATCTQEGERYRTCRNCRYEQTEATKKEKHDYGSWKTTKEATCEKAGERVRKCRVCDHEDRQKIDKLPHKYGEWTVVQEATCTEAGARTRECTVCGHVDEGTIKKLPHDWGEWEDIAPATDHSSGKRARTCRMCGAQETEDYDPEGTLRRGAKGDDVKQLQEGLICYGALNGRADGIFGKGTERAVRAVQEAEGLEADGVAWPQTRGFVHHLFGEWKTLSTLSRTTDGVRERTCERCGKVEREVVEARPILHRGDRGKPVEVIQGIIWDMGYDPGKIDGVYGPVLDRVIGEWAGDHEWYFEPGLLKPIDIDRIVNSWADALENRIGVSGPSTPVNLEITIKPDFTMIIVVPGQSLKYTYTVTNLGTEDCTLGPLFIAFGENKSYKADETYYRYVGDLGGEVLKAGGANTYTGSFTVSADIDKMEMPDPQFSLGEIQVNAWVLGTSKATGKRWYSNIDWAIINVDTDEYALEPNLELTGRVLGDREWYTVGDEFEIEATVKNNTGKDLYVSIDGSGRTWDGAIDILEHKKAVLLPAGESLTNTYPHRIGAADEIREGKYGFWLEARGESEAGEKYASPQVPLWVEVHSPYKVSSDDFVLTRESDDPEQTHYAPGETWRYRYRATNRGDVELHDVRIRAFFNDSEYWYPLDDAEPGTLAPGAHADLEGERSAGTVHMERDFFTDEAGEWHPRWSYIVSIVAEGVTPDGEVVYAKPIREIIPIDFEDEDGYRPFGLKLTGKIVDAKDEYADGDEVGLEVTLRNLSGEPLTEYAIGGFFEPEAETEAYSELDDVPGEGTLEAGKTWTKTFDVKVRHYWDTDDYRLVLTAQGKTGGGHPAVSNTVTLPVRVLAGKSDPERQSNYSGGMNKLMKNGSKVPPIDDLPGLRSLEVIKQTKEDDAYYDGAKIPVRMRLTIDDYDDYDFMGIQPYPGDSMSNEAWMHGVLEHGESYEFTYVMALDPEKYGWKTRNVTAILHSHSLDTDEVESCEVRPPWTNPTVTLEDPNVHIINDNMSYLYLKVDSKKFFREVYPNDILSIPFKVDSDGNTDIKNVKVHIIEQLHGKNMYTWSGTLRDRMKPGEAFDEWRAIRIKGTDEAQPSGYYLHMYLTGTIINRKGKQEEIQSLPIDVSLKILDPAEGKKNLSLNWWLEPNKGSYAVNDEVKVHLAVQNNTDTKLLYTRLERLTPSKEFKDQVEKYGRLGESGQLEPGKTDSVVLRYTIKPEDIEKKQIYVELMAKGLIFMTGKEIWSDAAKIKVPIKTGDLPQKLTAAASCEVSEAKPGDVVPVTLKVKNNSGKRVLNLRVYAVGDNRFASHDSSVAWHDCGHGVKGWQCAESLSLNDGDERIFNVPVTIPSPFDGKDSFVAQWIVEADPNDGSGTVVSNIASAKLGVKVEDQLYLTLTSYSPKQDTYAVGQYVNVSARIDNPAGTMPEDLEVFYTTEGDPDTPVKGTVVSVAEGLAYAITTCQLKDTDVVNNHWTANFKARGFGGLECEAVPFVLQMDPKDPEEPSSDIDLEVHQATECPNPEGIWFTGDKVKVQVKAAYKGEGTPKSLVVQAFRPGSSSEVWSSKDSDVTELVDEVELTLDAADGDGNHVVKYEFAASACMEDPLVTDASSDVVPVTVGKVYDSPEDVPDAEDDGKDTQINWTAVEGLNEIIEAEGNGEADEGKSDTADVPDEGDASDKAEDDGGITDKADGGDASGKTEDDGGTTDTTDGGDASDKTEDNGGTTDKADGSDASDKTEDEGETTDKADGGDTSDKTEDEGGTTDTTDEGDASDKIEAEGGTTDKADGGDASDKTEDEGETTDTTDGGDISDKTEDEGGTTDTTDSGDASDKTEDEGGTTDKADGGDTSDKAEDEGGTTDTTDGGDASDKTEDEGETTDTDDSGDASDKAEDDGGTTDKADGGTTNGGTPEAGESACMIAWVDLGEGTVATELTFCAAHRAVADAAGALVPESEAALDDAARLAAWQSAGMLWQSAADAEYDAWLAAAPEADRPVIEAEQEQFYAMLDARAAAMAEDPLAAAQWRCAQLELRACGLCAERHGVAPEHVEVAPNAESDGPASDMNAIDAAASLEGDQIVPETVGAEYRGVDQTADALLAGAQTPEARTEAWQTVRLLWQAALDGETHARLTSEDDAGREALEADRAAFAGWLEARAALLDLAYPDRPDIVNEILARAVRSRVAVLCAK